MMSRTWRTEARWLGEPDLSAWVAGSRLHLLRALGDHATEPSVQAPLKRYLTYVTPAIERLRQLDGSKSPGPERIDQVDMQQRKDPPRTPRVYSKGGSD